MANCLCGCGLEAKNNRLFVQGHHSRVSHAKVYYYFIGLCKCGCGSLTYGNKSYISGHSSKGKHLSAEHREKLSKSHRGNKHSQKTRVKMSISAKNSKNNGRFVCGQVAWNRDMCCPWAISHVHELNEKFKDNPELHPNRKMGKLGFVSKPQKKLYEIVKSIFPDAELEYPIRTVTGVRFADVGVPSKKLDFEYDDPYWHRNKEKSHARTKEIEHSGWVVVALEQKEDISFNEILNRLGVFCDEK